MAKTAFSQPALDVTQNSIHKSKSNISRSYISTKYTITALSYKFTTII